MKTLTIDHVSRWYGNVVAVNDISMTIGPGITGLLGPNGAGKSTLIHLMGGFLEPSAGTVTLDGESVWHSPDIYRHIGLVPETESTYEGLTGWKFVLANAKLQRLSHPERATSEALEAVEMTDAQERRIGTYSKGMRQRIKMATALVHKPSVLLLDEPFNGMDPRQRLHLMDLLRTMADSGRTILFSSHILEEVEQLASSIQVVVSGRHAASGDYREIRRLMSDRPHQYAIRSSDNRRLAAALIADGSSAGVWLEDVGTTETNLLRVHATEFGRFAWLLPTVARDLDIRLYDVSPSDESLESVFSYLVQS